MCNILDVAVLQLLGVIWGNGTEMCNRKSVKRFMLDLCQPTVSANSVCVYARRKRNILPLAMLQSMRMIW